MSLCSSLLEKVCVWAVQAAETGFLFICRASRCNVLLIEEMMKKFLFFFRLDLQSFVRYRQESSSSSGNFVGRNGPTLVSGPFSVLLWSPRA